MVEPREVEKVIFENFCECCELSEEGCIRPSPEGYGIRCPAFDAVQAISPFNPFVLRIVGRYVQCQKCGHQGFELPTSASSAPEQALLVCPNCGYAILKPEPLEPGFRPRIVRLSHDNSS